LKGPTTAGDRRPSVAESTVTGEPVCAAIGVGDVVGGGLHALLL
jgi:hypothetical protein